MFTLCCLFGILSFVTNPKTAKHLRLKQAGLLNPEPERLREQLFRDHSEFFDAHDLLQVRYELLRRHLVDRQQVVGLCDRYGISRQTFYNLCDKFLERGSAGLIPAKPGPRAASKLTPQVVSFARGELDRDTELSGARLAAAIETKFETSVHTRTIEKLLKSLRSKKNS
jgi:transposase